MTIVLNTLEPDIASDQVYSFFGKKDSQTEVINTSGMKISHCMGCNHCWLKTPGICAIKDDYEGIIKKLVGAENLCQIMQKTVTLHITSNVTDEQRTEDHAIIIKAIFSTSITFDENSTFSADSEVQDVHRDGSFSYWRFVIPQKIN